MRRGRNTQEFIMEEWNRSGQIQIELYARAVIEEVIQPDAKYEDMAYQALEEAEQNPGKYLPDRYTTALHNMIALYLNNKLISKDRLKEKMLVSGRMQWIFLADMDHFNYDLFEPEWLTEFSKTLCKSIAENGKAKSGIEQQLKQSWISNRRRLTEEILNRYFNCFV